MSCLTGLNIPFIAAEKARGRKIEIGDYIKSPFRVSQLETPIII